MLHKLRIEHIVLVDSCEVVLHPGFNVITGETGSGKSALLTAIRLILGDKAEQDTLRHGESFGYVEAEFDVSAEASPLLAELDLDGSRCTLRRELFHNGKSRAYINGCLVPIGALKRVGKALVEVSEQHAHLDLQNKEAMRSTIDLYGGHEHLLRQFQESYEKGLSLSKQLHVWNQEEPYRIHEIERLQKAIAEIENSKIFDLDDDELFLRLQKLETQKVSFEIASSLCQEIENGKPPIQSKLFRILQQTHKLVAQDGSWSDVVEWLERACSHFTEATNELNRRLGAIDYSEDERQSLNQTLSHIDSIKRKFGGSSKEVREQYNRMKNALSSLEARDGQRIEIEGQLFATAKLCDRFAQELHQQRVETALRLSKEIEEQLHKLNMLHATVSIPVLAAPRSISGDDCVQCLLTPNIGEKQLEICENASGGELARLFLSIQAIMADSYSIPTVLFDEVDANIGGITANMVGTALSEIGKKRQVLAVTHFVQVATKADAHFVLTKNTHEGRTTSSVRHLKTQKALEKEHSRMVGVDSFVLD